MTKDLSLTRKIALRVKLPKAARVLVLDDDPKRLQWLRESVREATGDASTCSTTLDEWIDELEGGEFDVVFLDHDLCWLDAAYSERKHGNGKEAARYLAWMGSKGMVVIHSVNEDGAKAMKRYLPGATVAPFGTFELEPTVSRSSVSIKKSDPL